MVFSHAYYYCLHSQTLYINIKNKSILNATHLANRGEICYNFAMIIEEIKVGKRKAVIITDSKTYDFSLETLYKERLVAGEIDPAKFFQIKSESDNDLAKQYIFSSLARSIKSKKDAISKLRQKGFYTKAIDYAISKAEEYKLIDDENYAKCYINTYQNTKGTKLLKYELRQKGIDEELIRVLLEDIIDDQEDACLKYAQKYKRIRGDKLTREKLFRQLYSKGFPNETIKRAVENVFRDTE